MALILFDTNIFIDMLVGCNEAMLELAAYDEPAISMITYMELRAGGLARPMDKAILDEVLSTFEVYPIEWEIAEQAITLRGKSLLNPPKIKLPDAIIGATAVQWKIPLVTRNPKDFRSLPVPVHVPYDYNSITGVVSNVRKPYGSPPSPLLKIAVRRKRSDNA